MGGCLPCLGGDSADFDNPSPERQPLTDTDHETRRRQQAEAAEKRVKQIESRGVKDPEALKRKQKRQEDLEKKAESNQGQSDGLRWQVG